MSPTLQTDATAAATPEDACREVKSVCPYCGVGCGIVMRVEAGRITKVSGDKTHPANFGRLCTKGSSCAQAIADSGRLEHAYARERRGAEPVRTPLQKALTEAGTRLRAIIDEHGPDAVALYVSGQMSLEAQYLANKLAKGYIGTNNIESNSRLCMASAGTGYKQSLGADGPPGAYTDFDQTDLILVIGANMADCHPILFLRMMDRVKAGAKLVVVDPRRSATADKASLFMQIRPGTDLALLNGLLHLLVKNGHTDPDFIAEFTEGWDAMPEFLDDYPPAQVAAITGLAEADIRQVADWIGTARNWMSCWTMGLNQSTHGTWHTNLICNLHLATGAICKPGSGPFSLTGQPNAMGGREMGYMGPGLPGQRAVLAEPDRRFVEQAWGIPAGTLRTETGGGTVALFEDMAAGKVKACWIICTNPVASTPNRKTTIAGLEKAELVIAQDAFLDTETNRYADILLPGALWAEAEGVMINSERNLTLMPQAIQPPGESMPDWRIIAGVAAAMGYGAAFNYRDAEAVFEEIKQFWNPKTGYDLRGASYARLRTTPLQWPLPPGDARDRHPVRYLNDGISQTLLERPDGNRPRLVFPTASGKGIFYARPFMPPAELPDDDYPLVLNTGRVQHQWHTMTKTGKIATLNKLCPGPFVEIHPDDAARLGIDDQDTVAIRSRRGQALLPASITDRVRPGNCFAPIHWNDVHGENLCINAVTNDAIDPASLQPEFKHSAVALSRVAPARKAESPVQAADSAVAPPPATSSNKEPAMSQIDALSAMLGLGAPPVITLDATESLYLQGYLATLRSEAGQQSGGVPFLPASAPLQAEKRIIVDGMLAGMFARSETSDVQRLPAMPMTGALATPCAAPPAAAAPLLILWASQTGNVEAYAQDCAQQLQSAGLTVSLMEMNAASPAQLASAARVLLLASTFGDGDPPDNAAAFWAALQDAAAPSLAQTRFAVLAFGDSNYAQFCGFGKNLEARLLALGAQALHPRHDCEPDFEDTARAWLAGITHALATPAPDSLLPDGPALQHDDTPDNLALMQAATAATITAATQTGTATTKYSRQQPYPARLHASNLLNAPGAGKETRQFIFDLGDSGLRYEAGDALGVWPRNHPDAVAELLQLGKLDGTALVDIKGYGSLPLAQALTQHLDIARITPSLIEFFSARLANPQLEALKDKEMLRQWAPGRHIADLLRQFPVQASPAEWTGVLKPLQPRLYSISSSPRATPGEVHLTVSVLRPGTDDTSRGGLCSSFLADGAHDGKASIFIQASAHFHPPKDGDTPIIMIGPGTGVAPFRGFLQEREASGAKGANWLFFGEQRETSDFYYRDELLAMQARGTLHRLDTAFSRDQAEKIYVQHRMLEQGRELWSWLQDGAHVYVCGDASRMAKDVDNALVQIVQQHGGMTAGAARDYVTQLASGKRYLRDVY